MPRSKDKKRRTKSPIRDKNKTLVLGIPWRIGVPAFIVLFDWVWVLTSGGSTSFGGILVPIIVLGVVSTGLGIESIRIIIGGLLNVVWSCLVIASWVYTCARERVGDVPYIGNLSLGELLIVAIPTTATLVLIELVYLRIKEPIKALVTPYVEGFTNTAKRVVLSPVRTVVAMKFAEALSLIAKLRGILRTFFRRDGFVAIWGYALLTTCLLLIPAVIYSDLAPEGMSVCLNALYFSIAGSLVMIGMGNGKSYLPR